MSGEDSKSSGEIGEKMAGALLQLMGWGELPKGIKIDCSFESEHDRRSHGDDRLFVYNSPFREDLTEVVHISVKHNQDGYPKNVDPFRKALKDHLAELATIVQCAQLSPNVQGYIKSVNPRPKKRHWGLLVWLHSNSETLEQDRRLDLGQMHSPELSDFPALFIDTARASFIHAVVTHFTSLKRGKPSFYYPRLGSIPAADPARSGSILPLELIASDIIPIKALDGERATLYLYLRENFSESALKKAFNLARAFGDAWVEAEKIHIGFSDYNDSAHSNERDKALMAFSEDAVRANVFSYKETLLNLS